MSDSDSNAVWTQLTLNHTAKVINEDTVKPVLGITSSKQPPAFHNHAFKFPLDQMSHKLTYIKQSPALRGQFWSFP